jgi:hypothetical protein
MNRLVEELIKEYRPEFFREAMAEGIQKGRAEGIREGTASLTIRLLTRRFGSLDSDIEERVRRLPKEELERLGEELLDFRSESALTEWLERTEASR